MQTRTISKQVTFAKPFRLAGLDGIHPPGTYTMNLEQEPLNALCLVGWRRPAATIQLTHRGASEPVAIDMQGLREALLRDSDQSTDPPAAPPTAKTQSYRVPEMLRLRAAQP